MPHPIFILKPNPQFFPLLFKSPENELDRFVIGGPFSKDKLGRIIDFIIELSLNVLFLMGYKYSALLI